MSSRVQKGGTTFKPTVRARPRPTSRQPSASVEPRSSVPRDVSTPAPSDSASVPPQSEELDSLSMPPPSRIPPRAPSISNTAATQPSIITPSRATPGPFSITPSRPTPQPISQPSPSPRPTPTPVSQPSRSTVEPVPSSSLEPSPSQTAESSDAPAESVSAHHQASQPGPSGAPYPEPVPNGAAAPVLALNEDTSVKVPAKRGRKKRNAGGGSQSDGAASTSTAKPKRKPRAKKVADDGTPGPTTRKRARRAVVYDSDDNDNDGAASASGSEPAPKKKRVRRATSTASSSAPRKAPRRRKPAEPVFDPDAGPGEDLDPTTTTMAALCEDTGQGRISSKVVQIQANHAAWKAANREKRARMKMLMEAKKYGRKDDEVEAGARQVNEPAAVPSAAPDAEVVEGAEEGEGETVEPAAQDATGSGFDYSQAMATSRFNVQVRIGPNGETIIDEESLFVDREEEVDTTEYTHVEESDTTKFVNSATYGKKFRGTRWSAEETELFFDALSQFGENYELISFVLPGRDRKACKNKFKAEDKKNPARIDHCLKNRVPYDIQTLERLTGKDFSGPTPEIRAPTPLTMRESTAGASDKEYDHSDVVRKQSGTPGLEVLGYAEDFGDDSDKDKDG